MFSPAISPVDMANTRPISDPAPQPRGRGGGLMVAGFLLVITSYVAQSWPPLVAGIALLVAVWRLNRSAWPQVLAKAWGLHPPRPVERRGRGGAAAGGDTGPHCR